jgi:hypothetical protein
LLAIARLKLSVPADCGANITSKAVLCPAAKVIGRVRPPTLYPLPVKLAWVTITLEPPVLLKLAGKLWVLPVCTDPKLKLEGVTVNALGATAVTESGRARVASLAFELMVRLPFSAPAVGGAQVMLIFMLCFGARIMGMLIPPMLKPAPDTAAPLTVTFALLELVMVAVCFWLVPTWTVPKAKELELAASAPGATTAAESGTLKAGFEAVLAMVMVPLPAVMAGGVKVTVKLAVWAAVSVRGKLGPLRL